MVVSLFQWDSKGPPGSWSDPSMSCCSLPVAKARLLKSQEPDSVPIPCGGVPAAQVMVLEHKEPFSQWHLLWNFFHIWATRLGCAGHPAVHSWLLPYRTSPLGTISSNRQSDACVVASCLPPTEGPTQAAGSGHRRKVFNGEIGRQGEGTVGQILSRFWGQEGYNGDRLLLGIIVLQFLRQGSFWSPARTCWAQHNADLYADHTSGQFKYKPFCMLPIIIWFERYCLSRGINDALVHTQFSPTSQGTTQFPENWSPKKTMCNTWRFCNTDSYCNVLVKMPFSIHGMFSICAGISKPLYILKFNTVLSGSTTFNQQTHS